MSGANGFHPPADESAPSPASARAAESARGRVLVIRGGAIGDFILTLPVLAALRAHLPTIHLEVLGYAHIAQLAVAGGVADAVRSIEARALAGFFARGGTLAPELQDYFAGFALIISYLYDPEEVFRENVGRCTKAQFIQGPHRPDDDAGIHATDVFLKPLERLAIFDADPVPRLPRLSTQGAGAGVGKLGGWVARSGPLLIHPGSGSPRKNWPEVRWAELVTHLAERLESGSESAGPALLIVGGEAEGDRMQRLAALARGRAEVAAHLPLPELARRMAVGRGFLGHDSGITHLAAALGLPALALWGETAAEVWRPRSDAVRLVRTDDLPGGLEGLSVEAVLAELARF